MRLKTISVLLPTVLAQNFDWDCTNSLGPCNNACFATNHGYASGILTYDANMANRGPRRVASGCSSTPCSTTVYRNFGNSCDEYPFASTHEGGAGAILRCVSATENSSEGGQLGNFYRTIRDGAQFRVVVRNWRGAIFCQNAAAPNDGGEFHLVGRAFQNAKRRDLAGNFVTAVPRDTTKKLRVFEDENGGELMLLDPNYEGTLVGTTVFDNGNWTRVVKEL